MRPCIECKLPDRLPDGRLTCDTNPIPRKGTAPGCEDGRFTPRAYWRGERTPKALAEYNAYRREMREGKPRGVRLDTQALRAAITLDGRSLRRLSLDLGLDKSAVNAVLKRGSCKVQTLDKLARALGVMDTELEVGS